MSTYLTITDVPYDTFNELRNKLRNELDIMNKVDLYYKGSSLRGDIEIGMIAGNIKEFNTALKEFTNIYCK